MKYLKIAVFIIFLTISFYVIFNEISNKDIKKKLDLSFIGKDDTVVDLGNLIALKYKIAIKDNIKLIYSTVGVKFLILTLNNNTGISNKKYSEFIFRHFIKINNLKNTNAILLVIYKNNPEVNFLFTEDLDFIFTKDFATKIVDNVKKALEKSNEYMNVSLKEGKLRDDRYKYIIGEGIYDTVNMIKSELEKAILSISKAEYKLRRKKFDDKRIIKRIFGNSLVLSIVVSLFFLIIGIFIYYNIKNRCPECGNRMHRETVILNYPTENTPGIKEVRYVCNVCGFTHKERILFKKGLF